MAQAVNKNVFRKGQASVTCPILSEQIHVTWTFQRFQSKQIPLSFYECKISDGTMDAHGYGQSIWLGTSARVSFYEAWERFWMLRTCRLTGRNFSSNGVAAGKDIHHAVRSAKLEAIERHLVLSAWGLQAGWQKLSVSYFLEKVLTKFLEFLGTRVEAYRLDSVHGEQVVCVFLHLKSGGFLFDSFCVEAGSKIRPALNKVLYTLMRTLSWIEISQVTAINGEIGEQGDPSDHLRFYLDAKNTDSLSFLEAQGSHCFEAPSLDKIEYEVLFQERGYPTVVRCFHPDLKDLRWGRNSVVGTNKWPHPIA